MQLMYPTAPTDRALNNNVLFFEVNSHHKLSKPYKSSQKFLPRQELSVDYKQ